MCYHPHCVTWLLSTPIQAATIIGAVGILVASHRLFLWGFRQLNQAEVIPDVVTTASGIVQHDTASQFRVMVPLSNPRTESQLISLASMVADANDGIVDAVHIVQIPDQTQTPFHGDAEQSRQIDIESEQLLDAAREHVEMFGVPVETTTIISRWSFEEMFNAIRQRDANMVIMGWGTQSRSWQAGRAERSIDELTQNLPCNFFILKGNGVDVSRVLVPIAAASPNADLSAEITQYLQDHGDAEISLLHVVDDEEQRAAGKEFLAEWAAEHDLDTTELLINTSGDVKSAIEREAQDRTLVIIGATERGLLSRLLQGSVASDVVNTIGCSVLLAERPPSRSIRERVLGSRER